MFPWVIVGFLVCLLVKFLPLFVVRYLNPEARVLLSELNQHMAPQFAKLNKALAELVCFNEGIWLREIRESLLFFFVFLSVLFYEFFLRLVIFIIIDCLPHYSLEAHEHNLVYIVYIYVC